jgi:hypothetical protein
LAAVTCWFAAGASAKASCAEQYESGWWENYDPNTSGVTWVRILTSCDDVRLNGEPSNAYPFYIDVFGSCTPSDCYWGQRGGTEESDGWILAVYDSGYATRYVWFRGYPGYSVDWLRVWVYTDFHDGREDYVSDNWMLRYE